jgi:hypothetical protein
MNIQTVAANLRNTIAGKELYHAGIERKMLAEVHRPKLIALKATKEFLEENIDELKRILQDVEVCCEQQMKIE